MTNNGQGKCERCDGSGMRWAGDFHVICGCREGGDNDETEGRAHQWWDEGKVDGVDDYDVEMPEWVSDRIEAVREAREMILEAIDRLEWAVEGTPFEDHTDAYVIAHLKILASGDHGYVSRDTNLDDVIRQLGGHDDEEDW